MNILARYIHGSEDSTDLDVIYITDRIPDMKDCPLFCNSDPAENRNIAVIENGVISWCYKGFTDEVNNSLLATYPLHMQEHKLLIDRAVPRDLTLKLLSVLRKIIMDLRHTALRKEAHSVLHTGGYNERMRLLRSTDLRQLEWAVPAREQLDRRKGMAYQLGLAVSLNDSVELYTKKDIAGYIPSLRPYLYRELCAMNDLEDIKNRFADIISAKGFEDFGNMTVRIPGDPVRYITLKGKEHYVNAE